MASSEINPELDSMHELKERFTELSKELDLNTAVTQEAWNEFLQINRNVTLEGDGLHWLACSLYVASRKLSIIREQLSIEIEGISVGKLIQKVKMSLVVFFQKVRKWLDMGKHGTMAILNEKIEQLERVFSVSHIVFDHYSSIFKELFKEEWKEEIKRGRKKLVMGTKEIFDFCWTLYISTKAQYPDISDDLVNSYHLLLCCLDMTFANVLSVKQLKGVIRPDFKGAPENYLERDMGAIEVPSVIDVLCQVHEGLPIETKIIRQQYLETYIGELLRNGHLKGNLEKRIGLLDIMNFDNNMKYLIESYDKHTFRESCIDENIFIKEDSAQRIGTPTKKYTAFSDVDDKENIVSDLSITLSVSRLQELVKGLKASPSDKLNQMFQSLKENPEEKVQQAVCNFSKRFLELYLLPAPEQTADQLPSERGKEFIEARLHLAIILFYKILENFLDSEINQKKTPADLSMLMGQELFLKCLFTCCLEIVIFSYKSTKVFPWVLKAYNLKPYNFFKIIELVIRSEDLSRDVIKHLSRIEEQILECLSWKSGSPIFIATETHGVPRCQEVASETSFSTPLLFMSPTTVRLSKDGIYNSPVMTMRGKLSSPLPASPARRNLFGSPAKSEPSAPLSNAKVTAAVVLPPKSSAITQNQIPIMLTSPGGQSPIRLYAVTPQRGTSVTPNRGTPQTGIFQITASPNKTMQKKFGSLGIFFRKLYHLASVRLKDLCENLAIGSELQKKIWTCFEHSVTDNVDLLQDRHLDQLIMCAIYVICKVSKEEKSFHEIMKWYRTQPQSHSDVYRHVLIKRENKGGAPDKEPKAVGANSEESYSEQEYKEGKESSIDTVNQVEEKYVYNDLIQFYNIVYIKKIKEFALKFAANKGPVEPLSPLPVTRKQIQSPRKLSKQHQIYISPIKSAPNVTPRSKMLFCFDSDSPKKLSEINAMIKGGTRRRVNFDEDGMHSPAKRPYINGLARRAEELRKDQLDLNRPVPNP